MIGMTGEEFFNAPAIERQLLFDSKDTRTGASASAAPELRTSPGLVAHARRTGIAQSRATI
jgi:hypothetical protein